MCVLQHKHCMFWSIWLDSSLLKYIFKCWRLHSWLCRAATYNISAASDANLRHHLKGLGQTGGVQGSPVTPWFSWGRRSCQWPPRLADGSQGSFRQPSCSQLWPLRPSTRQGEGQQQLLVLSTRRKCSCCQAAALPPCAGVRLADVGAQQPEDGDRFYSFSIDDVRGMTCLCPEVHYELHSVSGGFLSTSRTNLCSVHSHNV